MEPDFRGQISFDLIGAAIVVFNSELLSSVIGTIYEAAYDPEQWSGAIEDLRIAFDGSKACLAKFGPNIAVSDAIATNPDAGYFEKFLTEHAPYRNVLAEAMRAAPTGAIYSDHALVGNDRLRQSRFWNEWMAPQDMYGGVACKLIAKGSSFWFFDVQRGRTQAAFDSNELLLMGEIAPHLRRATQISQKLGAVSVMAATFEQLPFGVLIVDGRHRIVAMNGVAENLLGNPSSGLKARAGILGARHGRDAEKLHKAIENACQMHEGIAPGTGGDMLIRSDDETNDNEALAVSVGPLLRRDLFSTGIGPHAVVFVRSLSLKLPANFADHVRGVFGLTPKEAQLSLALAEGASLKEAADRYGVRFTTARSYLENIFQKTGVRQQSQLVAVLKTLQPILCGEI